MTSIDDCLETTDRPMPLESEADAARQMFATWFARARDSVLLLSRDGNVIEFNYAAAATFELEGSGPPFANAFEFFDEPDQPVLRDALDNLGDETRIRARCHSLTGKTFPAEVSLRSAGLGPPATILCTFRREAWLSHGEQERALAAIVQASDDTIISKTLDGTVTSWNPAAERLYGWTAAEMVGKSVTRIIPDDRLDEFYGILARLRRGESIDHHETVRVARDGSRIDVSISISPIRDDHGKVIGAAKIGRDVTARRRLERQQREFLMLAAHELRTPLTSLKVSAQLLQRQTGRNDQLVDWILNRVDHLGHLVDDLVDASRFETGPILRREEMDLTALAEATVSDWRLRAERHVIRLETPPHPVIGFWDRKRIEQVLSNLLDNAIAYSPGGEIVVAIAVDGNTARMTVSDEGPGIPAELLTSIFDPFVRQGSPGMNDRPGLGLGLSLCRALVEAHGGKIGVASRGPGATLSVELPLREHA